MNQQKKLVILAVIAIVAIAGATFFALKAQPGQESRSPQAQLAQIMKRGIDYSHSLFTPDETESLKKQINQSVDDFESGKNATVENLVDIGRRVRDVRDFDNALAIFAIADTMNPKDLFYKIDAGRIYLERQQWEAARAYFEPLRTTFPIPEVYLGLAQAYRHLDGTPNYVIDDIYNEAIQTSSANFEVCEADAHWLEDTGREELALPCYIAMNDKRPQPILQKRIKELETKYPNAKKTL